MELGNKAIIHGVNADAFAKALLRADQDGIVLILKPPVNQIFPLVRL